MPDKLYYAKGLEVWKSPVRTKIDGGESVSIGFHACTASEVIGEEGAIAIAALLCLGEQAQTPAPQPRAAVPLGWKIVPITPTAEMDEAGYGVDTGRDGNHLQVWSRMVSAAPEPAEEAGD